MGKRQKTKEREGMPEGREAEERHKRRNRGEKTAGI
jgi:hypothetical protein